MKNIIRIIIRNFTRKPLTNLINLLGLAISMTLVIVLSVYSYNELTTDNFHVNKDRVYLYGISDDRIYTPGILKENIDLKVPEVASVVRTSGTWGTPVFQVEGRDPVTSNLVFADSGFFSLFTYSFIEGYPESALNEPMSVVITDKLAFKLFGDRQASGNIIKLNNRYNLVVSAVIREPEANSCLSFSALTSIETRKIVQNEPGEYTEWGWRDFQTFVLLRKGASPEAAAGKILALFPEDTRQDFKDTGLTSLRKIYFSRFMLYGSNYLVSGDRKKVLILVMVAFLVLVIALINFINISSSQWQEKIRQTGIKKIVGARRSMILFEILGESFIFFLAALILAVELVNISAPWIRFHTGIHFNQVLVYSPGFILISVSVITVLSVLFSIIPALKISSSGAVDNLRKTLQAGKADFSFNSLFVTVQFIIATVLIAFTLLVQKQVRFGSRNLGFNQENIIGIIMTEQLDQKKDVLNNLLREMPEINEVTFTQYFPGRDISQWGAQMELNGVKKQLNFYTFSADAPLFRLMGLRLAAGRFYSEELPSDKGKVVVNETFLREQGITNPVGSRITMGTRNYEVAGVVKDFHFQPLTKPVSSLVIRNDSHASVCLAGLKGGDYRSLNASLGKIRKIASELSPSFPVEVSFFDQAVYEMYKSESRFRWIFSLMAGSAILICCLGILAMSLFVCQRRIREIGIRKVNGAKVSEILVMLNIDFVKWVALAFLISIPADFFVMQKWLQNFAYRTDIGVWIFALSGLLASGIALITVSWQSWHAATRNPVETLRYE